MRLAQNTAPAVAGAAGPPSAPRPRLTSIDTLRGLIMVIMALDHVRDFFSGDTLSPADLSQTFPALFFTRWITHFCAPGFMFLAGTSAFLYAARGRSKGEVCRFLWTRGLWLLVLEFTVVNWGWSFNLTYSFVGVMVIWALGISMIALAALIYLPMKWLMALSLAMVAGHNLLDPISFPHTDWRFLPWTLLHQSEELTLPNGRLILLLYPLVPWVGVMAAGYGFGQLYLLPAATRQRWLFRLGMGMVTAFVILRLVDVYGEPARWSGQATPMFTVMSFLNCTKYPPSLLYLLMTLGPALLLLGLFEHAPRLNFNWLVIFGRVPMFYYLLHLYLIHFAAGITALVFGRPGEAQWMLSSVHVLNRPDGYGYRLWAVYVAWTAVIALLYWPCRWYANLKQRSRNPWLSYL